MKYLICLFKVNRLFFPYWVWLLWPFAYVCLLFSMFLYVRIKTKGRGRETHTKTMHWRLLNCSKHFHLPVKFLEELLVWIYSCHWFLRWNLKETKGFSVPPPPYQKEQKAFYLKQHSKRYLASITNMDYLKLQKFPQHSAFFITHGFSFNNHYSKHWGNTTF